MDLIGMDVVKINDVSFGVGAGSNDGVRFPAGVFELPPVDQYFCCIV